VTHDLQMQTAAPIVVGPNPERQAIVVEPSTPPPSGTIQTTARPGTRWGSRQRNT
jgi:hypothetical protein